MADSPPRSKWTGALLGCLALLATWVASSGLAFWLIEPVPAFEVRLPIAVGAGLLLALGLSSFWSLAHGYGRGPSLAAMLQRARSGAAPQDGKPVIATGKVRALGLPLQSPLSGTPCVMYQYKMYYNHVGAGQPTEIPVYWGYVSRPFAIEGPGGRLRVLAVPMLGTRGEERRGQEVVERAQRLVQSTTFEGGSTVGSAFALLGDVFTDDDGVSQRHWRREGDDREVSQLRFEETLLPVDAQVSAHGAWSDAKNGIVVGDAIGSMVHVVTGSPDQLKEWIPKTQSFGCGVASATILTALGAGLIWFARTIVPTL